MYTEYKYTNISFFAFAFIISCIYLSWLSQKKDAPPLSPMIQPTNQPIHRFIQKKKNLEKIFLFPSLFIVICHLGISIINIFSFYFYFVNVLVPIYGYYHICASHIYRNWKKNCHHYSIVSLLLWMRILMLIIFNHLLVFINFLCTWMFFMYE